MRRIYDPLGSSLTIPRRIEILKGLFRRFQPPVGSIEPRKGSRAQGRWPPALDNKTIQETEDPCSAPFSP